jgi:hypothetical protein
VVGISGFLTPKLFVPGGAAAGWPRDLVTWPKFKETMCRDLIVFFVSS